MNRLEIRQQFRILSGRFDLVNDDGTDNGADFLIDSGQKWLDRRYDHDKVDGRVFKIAAQGDYGVTFTLARAIEEVWAATTGDGRWQLMMKSIQDMRSDYADMPSELDEGSPLYWTPAFLRSVTESSHITAAAFSSYVGFADVMAGEHYEYNGVIWMPPCDEEMLIEVWGKFYTEPLQSEEDKNYWSVNHPDVLIMAGLRQAEVFNRNTQGLNDFNNAIDDMLVGLDKDVVQQEIANVDQMEG